jgi:Rrf2 family protein
MLSQKAKYGIKALSALARAPIGTPVQISTLAVDEHIPHKFLEAILLALRNHGLVRSKKGKGGGYELLKPANQITYGEIIRILDGPLAPVPCASVTAYVKCSDCPDEAACSVRRVMKHVRDAMAGILDHTTLADANVSLPTLPVVFENRPPQRNRRKKV